jgi:hypothetical protein
VVAEVLHRFAGCEQRAEHIGVELAVEFVLGDVFD